MAVSFPPPRFDRRVMAAKLGELFGIDPGLIVDSTAEQSSDADWATITVEARMQVPLQTFVEILNAAAVTEVK